MKKISVIIPVFNAENLVYKSVSTMINQTIYNELEIIYINDGSTDNTLISLKKETKKYKNIHIIDKENGGVSSARNVGINHASCNYISFIDIDDYVDDDYFEKLFEYADIDLIITGFIAEYTKSKNVNKVSNLLHLDNNFDIMKEFILNSKIDSNCWNKLYKKNLIGNLRFDENLNYSEDYLFVFNYILKCQTAVILPIAKYHYVINDSSTMRKGFNDKRFKSIVVLENTTNIIKEKYPQLYEFAKSREMDTKCRVLADLYYFKVDKKYKIQKNRLINEIKKYDLKRKRKFSSKKHYYAYVLMKINPKLYVFFKRKLKFEFMNFFHK